VALAALGIISTRNPAAVPKYYAVFRALLPATGFIGGAALGHGAASGLNASGVFERDIPVAPAHVMHLGVEQDDFTRDDDTLVRTLAPMILSMGAFDATYIAIRGATLATDLLELIRTIRTVGMAAAVADSEIPPAFVATLVVTFLVDKLGTAAVDAYEFGSLKSDVIAARKIVDYGASSGDNVTIYRGADTLVAKSLALAAYVNQPIVEANSAFVAGMADAAKKYGQGTPAFKDELASLARDLSQKVREALEDSDQVGDADFEAYLALEALEHQDAGALDELPDLARDHARAYAEAFETYRQGFDAFVAQLEESQQQNLGESAREQAYNDYFRQYIHKMRDAKDQQLAAQLRAGDIPRHAGHVLLQAGALLRSTGREYVESQADFLMAEVAREQALVRAAMAQATQDQAQSYPGDPGPF
jgi:hypothetical protein